MAADLTSLDGLGSVVTLDGQIEAICWTHRHGGWAVHDYRGAGRLAGVRTKKEAYRLVRAWRSLEPSETYEQSLLKS